MKLNVGDVYCTVGRRYGIHGSMGMRFRWVLIVGLVLVAVIVGWFYYSYTITSQKAGVAGELCGVSIVDNAGWGVELQDPDKLLGFLEEFSGVKCRENGGMVLHHDGQTSLEQPLTANSLVIVYTDEVLSRELRNAEDKVLNSWGTRYREDTGEMFVYLNVSRGVDENFTLFDGTVMALYNVTTGAPYREYDARMDNYLGIESLGISQ